MPKDLRTDLKLSRVYSVDRITNATRFTVVMLRNSNTFKVYIAKELVKNPDKYHFVSHNKKTFDWTCTCWWHANRTSPNQKRWGYCSHVLGLLYTYSKDKFCEEIKRKTLQPNK